MSFFYFVDKEGVRQGPLPIEDLKSYEIMPNTLVWCKGMKKWSKAKDVEELAHLFGSTDNQKESDITGINTNKTDSKAEDSSETQESVTQSVEDTKVESSSGNYVLYIIGITILVLIAIFSIRSCNTSSNIELNDSLYVDTCSVYTIVDELSSEEEERIVIDFLTNMYNNSLYNEYTFLEKHCSRHLLTMLENDYDYDHDDVAYAVWDFRTSAQDSKSDSDYENKIIDVESIGDGWYTYEFYDGGWRGKKRVKAFLKDGEVIMDVLETVYDECSESYSQIEEKNWNLSGYMENDSTQYPILITFHQQGSSIFNCIYKNITYGGKISMDGSMTEEGFIFKGKDESKDFVIEVNRNEYENSWDGYSKVGDEILTTHLEE